VRRCARLRTSAHRGGRDAEPSAAARIFCGVIEIEARLSELEALGLHRRMRLVSGPQGPHAVVDGKPVLMLCSDNYLGLADHPRVREAAAEAAMRWGVGAGASRLACGTMTIHRRLEERLAEFERHESALLFGSGSLANAGVIAALARPGDVVFCDESSHASILDGCELSGAEVFAYDHLDLDHLQWGIAQSEGRGALIATESVFSIDGDLAPLAEIVKLARRGRVRLLVDESHAIGAFGPGGRGLVADAGLEDQVDVIVCSLATALGSYGAFVACERTMAAYLAGAASTFAFSTAPAPPAAAGALAALELLGSRPQLVARLRANAAAIRDELAAQGCVGVGRAQIFSLVLGDVAATVDVHAAALERGVFTQALTPPGIPAASSRLRLAVMATHRPDELRAAAQVLAQEIRNAGIDPGPSLLGGPQAPEPDEAKFDSCRRTIFDFELSDRLAA
jgi:8-amino-7-oxononanoate synthase